MCRAACYNAVMSVYIEPLIVQNLVLTYLIGATSYRLLRLQKDVARLALAAMTGCAASLFYPLLSWPVAAVIAVKLALGLLLGAELFVGKCRYWRGMGAFLAAALMFGGAVFAVGCLRFRSVLQAATTPLRVSWWACVAAALILYHAVRAAVVAYHRRADTSRLVYRYRCVLSGREVCGNGFLDTGNRLYDTRTGLPVVVLGLKNVLTALSDEQAAQLITGHVERVFAGARRIACGSVGGKSSMWVIAPEKFEVYTSADKNIVINVMVGLSYTALGGNDTYDAILHPAMGESA